MAQAKRSRPSRDITPIHPGAAAIDIGATMHVAAVELDQDPEQPVRSFGTFTGDLQRLADWFASCGVQTVAMESTGVYWIPVFEILDQRGFKVVLVNARDAKHVPGRKTDISDAQWLQRLHAYGLLRASFRPKGEIATLRAYLRLRERLLDYTASHIQHMQKALTQMNLQLHHVVTDITGVTGMAIIRAIVAGERDPATLAAMRDPRCHATVETIRQALVGNDREEHIFALTQAVELYDFYQAKVAECDTRIQAVLERLRQAAPISAGRPRPNTFVTKGHFESAEVEPGAHVEVEAAVRVHVPPEQGRERVQVAWGEAPLPLGPGEDLLDHEGVDVNHAVLQQVQAKHADFLVLATVAGELAAAGKEDEVVGAVPMLDHVQPVIDLAPERLVMQVATQEDRFDRLPKLCQSLVGGMLDVLAGEPAQDGLRLGRAQAQRRGVFDHFIVLPADQLPVDRPRQHEL